MSIISFDDFQKSVRESATLTAMFEKAVMGVEQNLGEDASAGLDELATLDSDMAAVVKEGKFILTLFAVYQETYAQINNENFEAMITQALSDPIYIPSGPN